MTEPRPRAPRRVALTSICLALSLVACLASVSPLDAAQQEATSPPTRSVRQGFNRASDQASAPAERQEANAAVQTDGADQPTTAAPAKPLTIPRSVAAPPARAARSLIPFFVSYAALQALDVHSTLKAMNAGAAEGNVVMAPFVSHPAAFVALKAGMTAGLVLGTARLSKRNRVAAFAVMIAANSAYAWVVAHNYKVANSIGR